ncbi:MAG: agmatinase family protein [Candidatus Gracilibacteria bacterium]|nr:agmatinase family protein [Candidatus Gracilibacteria bacterium]
MKNQEHEGFMNRSIQTFMKSDYVDINELDSYDIAYVGVPVEYGASYRRGQALAPKSIREHSYWDSINGANYFDTQKNEEIISNRLSIADVGDIHITPTDTLRNQQAIIETVANIRKKCFPLIIGGDHSISYSTIQGVRKSLSKAQQDSFGVLHFDAHLDMENEYLDMPSVFHGNPFRKLIEAGIINGKNHYAVGPRGMIPSYLMDFVRKNNVNLYTTPEIRKTNFEQFVSKIILEMRERFQAVFVTFDVDCIDTTEMRGTGTPMEGGFSSIECQYFLRKLQNLPVVGFELVELAPQLDPSGLSSIISTNLLWNFLSFGLEGRKKN